MRQWPGGPNLNPLTLPGHASGPKLIRVRSFIDAAKGADMNQDRQEVWDALTTRASQLFGKDPSEFTEDTKFADLGIKSVQVSQITTYLEDELDIEVPYMKFRRCATFGEATDFVCDLLDQ